MKNNIIFILFFVMGGTALLLSWSCQSSSAPVTLPEVFETQVATWPTSTITDTPTITMTPTVTDTPTATPTVTPTP